MEYRKTIILKDGRECILRNGTESDGKAVLDNFILTHEQTDYLLSYPDEHSYTVEQEAAMLKEKTESTDEIEILDPSTKPEKPKINYITSLLPALLMFAPVVVLRGIMSTSGGTFVIFSICSMGLGVFTSIMQIVFSKKEYREAV